MAGCPATNVIRAGSDAVHIEEGSFTYVVYNFTHPNENDYTLTLYRDHRNLPRQAKISRVNCPGAAEPVIVATKTLCKSTESDTANTISVLYIPGNMRLNGLNFSCKWTWEHDDGSRNSSNCNDGTDFTVYIQPEGM